nr:MAG: hypothetical protein AM324_14850 [Candidatus Thorarchaeota archaeon SMTZ1-83]
MIVYSRRDEVVPTLDQFSNAVDKTPPAVMASMRDSICTVIEVGSSMEECYREASETALAIQNAVT